VPMLSVEALIARATSVLNPRPLGENFGGQVAAALVTDQGNVYLGVCMDISSGIGFCAEHSAIAAMVTAGESRISRIVAVKKDQDNRVSILAPCGRCREFIRQIHPENLTTQVILSPDKVLPLADLLPYYDWSQKLENS